MSTEYWALRSRYTGDFLCRDPHSGVPCPYPTRAAATERKARLAAHGVIVDVVRVQVEVRIVGATAVHRG